MALKKEIVAWTAALEAYDNGDTVDALEQFMSFADTSKIHFDAGMCAIVLTDGQEAIKCFNRALELDPYMAVGYFQRGVCFYYLDNIESAIKDFEKAQKTMRDNAYINYTQLGLDFILYTAHILFNISLCFMVKGDINRALNYLSDALSAAPTSGDYVPGESAPDKLFPYELADHCLFRPNGDNVKNSKKVDMLGKSKVVLGFDQKDGFAGFSGRKIKENTLGKNYHKKDKRSSEVLKKSLTKKYQYDESLSRKGTLTRRAPTISRRESESSALNSPRRSSVIQRRTSSFSRRSSVPNLSNQTLASPLDKTGAISAGLERTKISESPFESVFFDDDDLKETQETLDTADSFKELDLYEEETNYNPYDTIKLQKKNDTPNSPPKSLASDTSSGVPPDMIKVRCHWNDTRVVLVPQDVTLDELVGTVTKKFKQSRKVALKFKDEEGDVVVMANEDDLDEAIDISPPGRLEVWCFLPD